MKRAPASFGDIAAFLSYDGVTGQFVWIADPGYRRFAGRAAGRVNMKGYVQIQFAGRAYQAHRLAWLFTYGAMPDRMVDHINGVKTDNRMANLRLATNSQNQFNRRPNRGRTLPKGVTFDGRDRRFRAEIGLDGVRQKLGSFRTAEAAHEAYCIAAHKYYGEFARTE